MARVAKGRSERVEKRIIDDVEIKVREPSVGETRPEYRCTKCNISFPSQLDLSEHQKVDHAKAAALT